MPGQRGPAAVDNQLGALRGAHIEIAGHLVPVGLGHQRAHLGSVLVAGTDLELGAGRNDALPQGVRRVLADVAIHRSPAEP
ncbi:hypothetical protein ACWD00_40090 [Streptomyces viridiviolaceus]